jgi:hypothetical protein
MEMWTEIRRQVFVEGASKRSIRRDFRVSARTLEKILANAEPPGCRQSAPRPKPQLGQFLGVIDEMLLADRDAPANGQWCGAPWAPGQPVFTILKHRPGAAMPAGVGISTWGDSGRIARDPIPQCP